MNILFFGTGAAALRYLGIVKAAYPGSIIHCVTGRDTNDLSINGIDRFIKFSNLEKDRDYYFSIIANAASCHLKALYHCYKENIPALVEKPLVSEIDVEIFADPAFLTWARANVKVAFNLRFTGSAVFFREKIKEWQLSSLISAQAFAGSYLPDWRSGVKYQDSASANLQMGGGVLREYSHEIDYIQWLAAGHNIELKYSRSFDSRSLDLNSVDDVISMVGQFPTLRAANEVIINLNFCSRAVYRICRFIFSGRVITWDLVNHTVFWCEADGKIEQMQFKNNEIEESYGKLFDAFVTDLSGNEPLDPRLCSFDEALSVQRVLSSHDELKQL